MSQKRGQGLSLTTIVIAALSILVLVVLAVIFTGRIGKFTQEADSCGAKGGRCVLPSLCQDGFGADDEEVRAEYKCTDQQTQCCMKKAALSK